MESGLNAINIITEHQIIRNTIGYDGIKEIPLEDLPHVLHFLKIVDNYQRLKRIEKEKHEKNN
jgi:hypothetical protein